MNEMLEHIHAIRHLLDKNQMPRLMYDEILDHLQEMEDLCENG